MSTSIITGRLQRTTATSPGVTTLTMSRWVQQKLNYVPGGITFTYPTGIFQSAPVVRLSHELVGLTYASDLCVSLIITANSATACTVRANVSQGTTAEAQMGDLLIHLHASS